MNSRSNNQNNETTPLLANKQRRVVLPSINDGAFQPLPNDLIRLIASMLSLRDVAKFMQTNTRIHEIILDAFRMKVTRNDFGAWVEMPFLVRESTGRACTYAQVISHLNEQRTRLLLVDSIKHDTINGKINDAGVIMFKDEAPSSKYLAISLTVMTVLLMILVVPTLIVFGKVDVEFNIKPIVFSVEAAVSIAGGTVTGVVFYKRAQRLAARQAQLESELDNTLPEAMGSSLNQ